MAANAHLTANDLFAAAPDLMKKWTATSMAVAGSLEPSLVHLVEIRASQINGCANCLNMHTEAARAKGETEQRIYLLSAWREAPCYTDRERAALGWTEALTRLCEGHDHRSAYQAAHGWSPPYSAQRARMRTSASTVRQRRRAAPSRPCLATIPSMWTWRSCERRTRRLRLQARQRLARVAILPFASSYHHF
jgi:AhpD family alkylhydroperoxidase